MNGLEAVARFREASAAVRSTLADVDTMIAEKRADEEIVMTFARAAAALVDAVVVVVEVEESMEG